MQTGVLEYFERTVARSPERIGVSDESHAYSFREMAERAAGLAAYIAERTEAVNTPVGVFLPKSAETVTTFLAILMSGNAYMPLDLKFPRLRVKSILDHIGPSLVITTRAQAGFFEGLGLRDEQLLLIEEAPLTADEAARQRLLRRRQRVLDTDPAYIMNTSGSTGVPKGVAIPHRGIIDYIDWAIDRFELDAPLVIGNQAPFCFDNSTLDLYLTFALGGTLVLIPEELFAFPVRLIQYLAEKEISFIFWVPSALSGVAGMKALDELAPPALTKVFFCGEVMPTRHLNYWRRRLPRALYVNLYGPTEITDACTYFIVDREFDDNEPLPIGFACRNTEILILNEEDASCLPGEQGELCVRGSSLALGYWNDPEKTARAFVQNPLNPHHPERIYRTGDTVYRNERGEIMFVGRKDFQIKHMGYRIELADIEHQIVCLEGIANASVVYDQERLKITLFYETDGRELTPGMIRQQLVDVLPKYMMPTAFYRLDSLPRNANGKIDRNGLKLQLQGIA